MDNSPDDAIDHEIAETIGVDAESTGVHDVDAPEADEHLAAESRGPDEVAAGTTSELRPATAENAAGRGAVRTNTYVDERAVATAGSTGEGWFGYLVGAVMALAAIAAVVFLYNADSTDDSSMVARRPAPAATATAVPTPEPTAAPTVAPVATAVPTPEPTATPEPPPPTAVPLAPVPEIAASTASLSTLAAAVDQAGLTEDLRTISPITVFAPTNDAFDNADLDGFTDDELEQILRYHVSEGELSSDDLDAESPFPALSGEAITVMNGRLNGEARILQTDIQASNGLVHTIDRVLIPASLERARAERALNELVELDPIQFETASARILPESEPILDQAIEVLDVTEGDVEIQGHTDSRGGEAANQRLSQARAESVLEYLVSGGVDAERLVATGYGETELKVSPEETDADLQTNRRIEFKLS